MDFYLPQTLDFPPYKWMYCCVLYFLWIEVASGPSSIFHFHFVPFSAERESQRSPLHGKHNGTDPSAVFRRQIQEASILHQTKSVGYLVVNHNLRFLWYQTHWCCCTWKSLRDDWLEPQEERQQMPWDEGLTSPARGLSATSPPGKDGLACEAAPSWQGSGQSFRLPICGQLILFASQ